MVEEDEYLPLRLVRTGTQRGADTQFIVKGQLSEKLAE